MFIDKDESDDEQAKLKQSQLSPTESTACPSNDTSY